MPFDIMSDRSRPLANTATRRVALWLFILCGMILVMVSLGGATRLTGSGLSIMEWAPIMGSLPPLSEAEWQRLFTLYQRIPQYALVNQGFGIDGFKQIFWLEWSHRLWGRLMGFAFLIPLLWFAVRKELPKGLWVRLVGLLVLGGLQGAVGWVMVASGFDDGRTSVSAYRLVAHLTLALILFSSLLWTALGVWRTATDAQALVHGSYAGLRRASGVLLVLVALTIAAGGFVAGLKAGLTYNTFPLMDGHLVPEGYGMLQPWWRNLFENVAAVQFDHRLLATSTALFALVTVAFGMAARPIARVRGALIAVGIAVTFQYALGVATLMWVVPVSLGTAHQAAAVVLLTASIVLRHALRPGAA